VTQRRVVAVLSGGGVKAAAHVGAWRALQEAGLDPTHVVGTSMGAIVGAALAAGRGPVELAKQVRALRRRDVASLNPVVILAGIRARSVLRSGPLRSVIERLVPARRFEDLRLPLTVTATDLDSGRLMLYGASGDDVPLIDALYASAALPVYYPATIIAGRRVGDGGIRGALPLDAAARVGGDLVVAIDVGPGFEERNGPPPRHVPGLIRAHGDATGILMAQATQDTLERWRSADGLPPLVYVRPKVERGATFELRAIDEYERRGYEKTVECLAGYDR
jgi:NTE family protein